MQLTADCYIPVSHCEPRKGTGTARRDNPEERENKTELLLLSWFSFFFIAVDYPLLACVVVVLFTVDRFG
jgi:hypothetical protein